MRGTERALIMRTHALSFTVLLAWFLTTTCAFETSLTPRSMNSATTTSRGVPETNNGLLTSIETSAEITTPPQSAVQQSPSVEPSVMGHEANVSRNGVTSSAGLHERTSTVLHKLVGFRELTVPPNPPTVATKHDYTTRGTVSQDDWKAATVQTTLFVTLTRGVSSLPELPSNTDDARSHTEPLTELRQSSDVTQPSLPSSMPTQPQETHTHPSNSISTVSPLLQDLTSDGITTYNGTPTAHNYTQVRSQQYTNEPILFSTTDSPETQTAQNTRPVMVTTEKDSTAEGTSIRPTVTPQIQTLTSEGNGTSTADNYMQDLLSDGSLLNSTIEVSEAYTGQTTGTIRVSTTESTSLRTTVTTQIQDLTSEGNGTSTADNYTQALFSDGTLRYTKEPLLSSATIAISETTAGTIKENITMTTEKVSTTDSTPNWTTLTSLFKALTSDVATTFTSTGSTVDSTQVQTVDNESTEEPWAPRTTVGVTSEAGTHLKTEATSLHHTTNANKTERDTVPETTHRWTTLWASTNTSENISISDTELTLWVSCRYPDENLAPESWRSSRFTCFITIWSLGMTASVFLGVTIFLWVRLSMVKKRARRKGWGTKDVGGPGGMERKSLWAEHDSSAAERVEFWYANGTTLEADKRGEGNQKKGKMKKQKRRTGKEEDECIQPRVTLQDISQFWYSNRQVGNDRLQSQSELGDL